MVPPRSPSKIPFALVLETVPHSRLTVDAIVLGTVPHSPRIIASGPQIDKKRL